MPITVVYFNYNFNCGVSLKEYTKEIGPGFELTKSNLAYLSKKLRSLDLKDVGSIGINGSMLVVRMRVGLRDMGKKATSLLDALLVCLGQIIRFNKNLWYIQENFLKVVSDEKILEITQAFTNTMYPKDNYHEERIAISLKRETLGRVDINMPYLCEFLKNFLVNTPDPCTGVRLDNTREDCVLVIFTIAMPGKGNGKLIRDSIDMTRSYETEDGIVVMTEV